MTHFVYILETRDGRLYTGYTNDLSRRLSDHKEGRGAKFTRAFGVKTLVYSETFDDKSKALKREWQIKQMTRQQKLKLIQA